MPNNLTGSTISSTYPQLLHVGTGSPAAGEKTIYGGTGVATAVAIGTDSLSVDNIRLNGNTISSIVGDINITPQGVGQTVITNAVLAGVTVTATTLATGNTTTGCNLDGNTLAADGTSANIDLNITPKGTGEVNITNVDILSGKVPFNTITNRAYGMFYDAGTTDQTGSTTAATAVKWATAGTTTAGITIASNSRITLAVAGTYRFNASLQFNNSAAADYDVTLWFSQLGVNIPFSAAKTVIPKIGDGGKALVAYEIFVTVSANDYVELYWYPENTAVTLHYIAPVAASPGVTPAIPATATAIVVVERVA